MNIKFEVFLRFCIFYIFRSSQIMSQAFFTLDTLLQILNLKHLIEKSVVIYYLSIISVVSMVTVLTTVNWRNIMLFQKYFNRNKSWFLTVVLIILATTVIFIQRFYPTDYHLTIAVSEAPNTSQKSRTQLVLVITSLIGSGSEILKIRVII